MPMDKTKTILDAMQQDPKISTVKIAILMGISSRSDKKRIKAMRENGMIRRVGPDKGGCWEVPQSLEFIYRIHLI